MHETENELEEQAMKVEHLNTVVRDAEAAAHRLQVSLTEELTQHALTRRELDSLRTVHQRALSASPARAGHVSRSSVTSPLRSDPSRKRSNITSPLRNGSIENYASSRTVSIIRP